MATRTAQESISLRPEATSSIARAYIENGITHVPWKVYTCGPMFRYERLEKMHYRQFHEISVGVLGAPSISYDVQLITMFDRFFSQTLSLNGYALMLNFLGCVEDQTEYKKRLNLFLDSNKADGICDNCRAQKEKNVLRIFTCKNVTCQAIYQNAPRIIDNMCTECAQEWTQLQDELDLLCVTYTWNPSLIPDFDYYNKTIFEFASAQLGPQSRFCSGSRNDHLIRELGGQDQPSVGAALDLERLMILLEPVKETLQLPQAPALTIILPLAVKQQILALLSCR